MPFKDFTTEILTSADVDLYLMSQVIIRCTSSTRPASPALGWHIYETDTLRFKVYNGSTWVDEGREGKYAAKSYVNSSTNISTGNSVTVAFPALKYDYGGLWSSGANSRLTVPAGGGGLYLATASIRMSNISAAAITAPTTLFMNLRMNGTIVDESIVFLVPQAAGPGHDVNLKVTTPIEAVPSDYFDILMGVGGSSGPTWTITTGATGTKQFFAVTRMRE